MAMAKVALGCDAVNGSLTSSGQAASLNCHRQLHRFSLFNVFATVGGNPGTVYRCVEGGIIALLQSYIDEDSLVGHGDSINEIRTQPLKPSLIISAGKDESVRLWKCGDMDLHLDILLEPGGTATKC